MRALLIRLVRDRGPFEHLGVLKNGKEDRDNPQAKDWTGAKEAYSFSEKDGVTTVAVDADSSEEMEADFLQMAQGPVESEGTV